MAKGNMLQGMARGKVGDVVFSRLNGEQISRVRNRHPKNPRTNPQLIQRAIMATCMQMYSAGKEIFDHSFQGKAVGAENQREFLSRNAKALRNSIAADIASLATQQPTKTARVVAPGQVGPVPYSFIISDGTYQQNLFTVALEDVEPYASIPQANEGETVAAYAARMGLIADDIFTIVLVASSDTIENVHSDLGYDASTPAVQFAFVRLTVKQGLSSVNEALTSLSQLFTIEKSANVRGNVGANMPGDTIGASAITGNSLYGQGALGVIRSRLDQDLRSKTTMVFASDKGITAEYIVPVWSAGASQLGDSDLILEGGDF